MKLSSSMPCGRQCNGPSDVPVLIPGICDYVTSHGKGDFEDVIQLKILSWEIILVYLGGHNIITGVLIRGNQEGKRKDVRIEAEARVVQGPESSNVRNL